MLSYLFMFHKKRRNVDYKVRISTAIPQFLLQHFSRTFLAFCHTTVFNFSGKTYAVIRLLTQSIISLICQGLMFQVSVREFPIPFAIFVFKVHFLNKKNSSSEPGNVRLPLYDSVSKRTSFNPGMCFSECQKYRVSGRRIE